MEKSLETKECSEFMTKIAGLHWAYLEEVLKVHGVGDGDIGLVKFHYKSAFVHGFKHGVEYALD